MSFLGIAHRLISGISMAVLLFTALFCLPDIGVPFILAALAAIMALEFYQMLAAGGVPIFSRYGTIGVVALYGFTWWAGVRDSG